ncbi:MAG: 4Fe-4S binding protein [Desulfobacterales bacterium]|nr:4Fe-4S binding protein [Desulfobacterales bacterium]
MNNDIHEKLAKHLSMMGIPYREALVEILKENFTEKEAEIALMLPTTNTPLKPVSVEELSDRSKLDHLHLSEILNGLANRGLIYSGKTQNGDKGYALHQAGFGFPQAFFWKGEDTPYARKMTKLVLKYFNRKVTKDAFGGKETKAYRYIPVNQSLNPDVQAILPHDRMETVLNNAERFAVAHCPCRVEAGLMGRSCEHPLEVCLKFDEMAEYLIDHGIGRELTRAEAREIVRQAAEAGLVHFVDNAAGKVKHNCNCCGCACWNVGSIRRRKIPRDELMAVYFIRETDPGQCVGCGECMDICPVEAIRIEDDIAVVDEEWCIGCGLCATKCEFDALCIKYREDQAAVPTDFEILHKRIKEESGKIEI